LIQRDSRSTSFVFLRGSFKGESIFFDCATAVFTRAGDPASVVAEANRRARGGTDAVFPTRCTGDAVVFDMNFVVPTLDAVRRISGRGSEGVLVAVATSLLGVFVSPSVLVLIFL
jgi:hypothetical protein